MSASFSTSPSPRIVVFTAPSGAGKSTIARQVLRAFPRLRFSVSATTRPPRDYERSGVHYHFMTETAFRRAIDAGELLEHEEVYPGRFYGTLRRTTDAATTEAPVLLDIEVKGAMNVKRLYGDDALILFIEPPSLDELERRLRERGTEDEETLRIRLARAAYEITCADQFDAVVPNNDLQAAIDEAVRLVGDFLGQEPQPTML